MEDVFNYMQKVLPFISKSWAVQKEIIQLFDIKTKITIRIKCA